MDTPVLLIAYRRHENVERILNTCLFSSNGPIYVVIDAPNSNNEKVVADVQATVKVVQNFSVANPNRIQFIARSKNAGCAASVLSACDWFFSNEPFGIVLEDDCIPGSSFFELVEEARSVILENDHVWLACGTQFAPNEIVTTSWGLSSYPLIWGWATSQEKWQRISELLRNPNRERSLNFSNITELAYWRSGARRASIGWTDVWDTLLVQQMYEVKALAILPAVNLVSNVGNDTAATHTLHESAWLNRAVGIFNNNGTHPVYLPDLDLWLKKNLFRISFRHLITTKITAILDLVRFARKPLAPLATRWGNANIEISKLKYSNSQMTEE